MPEDQPSVEGSPSSFGSELRKQREIREVSLREIADSTKISKRFLEAMEQDDFRTLPAPVFTRGFIREYSRYLGLSPDEMITRYEQFLRVTPGGEADAPQPLVSGRIFETAGLRQSPTSWLALLMAVLVGALIATIVIRFPRKGAAGTAPAPAPLSARLQAAVAAPPANAPTPVRQDVAMTLRAHELSWIKLSLDGVAQTAYEIRPGEERTYQAHQRIELETIGNAGGVELTVNGRTLPPLGPSGKILHNILVDGRGIVSAGTR